MAPPLAPLQAEFACGALPVRAYRGSRSGMTCVHVRNPGPLVHGFFCVATEAHDDDGLPHTLEHLIFLGSKKYPYKGILDMVANRCFARGTNAWTAVDHTAYTMEHAGADGFLALVPVYVDHILRPTLTDSGFHTEVHHIDGDGEDAGVVYCEMQARENTSYSLAERTLMRAAYPQGCGYRSETGGIMKNLRESCSNQKVRDYHRDFYRADGICFIVVGDVPSERLEATLEQLEADFEGPAPDTAPPLQAWTKRSPALTASQDLAFTFPSDDEKTGIVVMAWQTCANTDVLASLAVSVLLDYLLQSSISPLQRDMVECDDAFAGSIRSYIEPFDTELATITFDSVPTAKLGDAKAKALDILGKIADGTEAFDMSLMKTTLARLRLDALNDVETHPEQVLPDFVIPHFLYGDGSWQTLQDRMGKLERLDVLAGKDAAFWQGILRDRLVSQSCITVVGTPSAEFGKKSVADEEARLAAQKETLGPEKMKALGEELKAAIDANETPYDPQILAEFKVPPVDGVATHAVGTVCSKAAARGASEAPGVPAPLCEAIVGLPFAAQFDDVKSSFTKIALSARVDDLNTDQALLLPVLMSSIWSSAVQRGDELVSWEAFVQDVTDASLSTGATVGFGGGRFACGAFGQAACVSIKTDSAQYDKCVKLLIETVWHSKPTAERIKVQANKALNSIPSVKRNGASISGALLSDINFVEGSNHRSLNMIRQQEFLTKLVERLGSEPDAVIAELAALRAVLLQPGRLYVHVTGRLSTLGGTPAAPWLEALAAMPPAGSVGFIPKQMSTYLSGDAHNGGNGVICGVSSVESGFMNLSIPAVDTFEHPDLAPIMVVCEYLCALEGPFWIKLRGPGLTYSYGVRPDPEAGLLTFNLFKSTNVAAAAAKAAEIVRDFASGATPMDALTLETAISSTIYAVVARSDTALNAGWQSNLDVFRGVDAGYNMRLVGALRAVTLEDTARVLKAYFVPLFDPARSNCAVCCSPGKVAGVVADFAAQQQRTLKELPALETAFAGPAPVTAAEAAAAKNCQCPRCFQLPFRLP